MDGYVILNTLTDQQLILDGWWVDPSVLPILEDYWTYTWIAIEELTSVFKIAMDAVTGTNPVLPKSFPEFSTFYQPPATFGVTDKIYYLHYWEIAHVDLPLDAVPGMESYNIKIKWYYRDDPPDPNQDYLLPYNQQAFDAGDGQQYLYSDFGSTGYNLTLWRHQQWIHTNRYLCNSYAIYFHELGGDPDWSDYWVEPDENVHYFFQDDKVPPEVSKYLGGNVWNISDEFSAAIEIDSGMIGDMNYYYLTLGSCSLVNSKTALKGAPPVEVLFPTNPVPVIIGLELIISAFMGHINPLFFGCVPMLRKTLSARKKIGFALNGVPQGIEGQYGLGGNF
jgi:hypothetical protein